MNFAGSYQNSEAEVHNIRVSLGSVTESRRSEYLLFTSTYFLDNLSKIACLVEEVPLLSITDTGKRAQSYGLKLLSCIMFCLYVETYLKAVGFAILRPPRWMARSRCS